MERKGSPVRFSIIVVCLNPGEKLNQTLDSILRQSYGDYEIVVKDGGSKDGSTGQMRKDERIRLYVEQDTGIYDAMNQAVAHAGGEFILFLNCGDVFEHATVLEETADRIAQEEDAVRDRLVLYGDTYGGKNGVLIASPPQITGFACYRNIPCHQSCFYAAALCREKPYDPEYRIRADYEHFLWCYYVAGAKMVYLHTTVSSYEGGGYSESAENRKRDKQEHRQITESYMSRGELMKYRAVMLCTLAPLRSFLSESRLFSGGYHWLKGCIYHRKKWIILGILLFLLEVGLLLWPGGLVAEDAVHFLAGEGMWLEGMTEENTSVCQVFVPKYANVKSIGFYLSGNGQEVVAGNAVIMITDKEDEILFRQEIPCSQLQFDAYSDIEMNLVLNKRDPYYLTVDCGSLSLTGGGLPYVGVCSMEYDMPENLSLLHGEEMPDVQLLTRYHYQEAIPFPTACKIIFLALLTALGVGLGLPDNRWIKRAVGLVLFLATPAVLGSRLEMLTVNGTSLLPNAMQWNIGLMYLLEIVVLLCTGSLRGGVILTNTCMTLLYSVNYYVYTFRAMPFRLNDIAAVRTAAHVAGNYSLKPNSHLAMAWCIALLCVVYSAAAGRPFALPKGRVRKAVRLGARAVSCGAGVILMLGTVHSLLHTEILEREGFQKFSGVNQHEMYQVNGYLISTCFDIRDSKVQMPPEYSVKRVEETLRDFSGDNPDTGALSQDELPHVILIANESFADLRVLGDLQLSQENMECFYSLTENTIRGYTNVSGLGGGTANSEFEVFTGCSMGFLPQSYYPYQQCINRPVDSLVSQMEGAGYTTYSMHPELKTNYNRESVYEYLGFDHSLWLEDFEGAEKIHYGVSDSETFHRIEEIFENREEKEKIFVFNMTIQNHGGYTASTVEHTVTAVNSPSSEADTFLSLMKESDEAFGQLIHYFEEQDERVIICMFGDHQPLLTDTFFYENIYGQTDGLTEIDKKLNQYKTPFVIWANYDIPEEDGIDISLNYLGPLLLETVGIPMSPYFSYLEELMEEYPVITVNGYKDKENNFYNWSGGNDEFPEYRMIQYYYLFDKNNMEWAF